MTLNLENLDLNTEKGLCYLAGFIDADGSIIAQLVPKDDYRFKYQVRISVQVTQKTNRFQLLKHLHEHFSDGYTRTRNDKKKEKNHQEDANINKDVQNIIKDVSDINTNVAEITKDATNKPAKVSDWVVTRGASAAGAAAAELALKKS
jgi:hypothetical protein